MPLSTYRAQLTLNAIKAATTYLSISSTPYSADGTGGTEPAGGWYGRISILGSEWTLSGHKLYLNTSKSFANTPDANAGSYPYGAIWTAATSGNMEFFGTFDSPVIVVSGSPIAAFAPTETYLDLS